MENNNNAVNKPTPQLKWPLDRGPLYALKGKCLLCLTDAQMIDVKNEPFYCCADHLIFWDATCDNDFFFGGREYDAKQSARSEKFLEGYSYVEEEVAEVFAGLRKIDYRSESAFSCGDLPF